MSTFRIVITTLVCGTIAMFALLVVIQASVPTAETPTRSRTSYSAQPRALDGIDADGRNSADRPVRGSTPGAERVVVARVIDGDTFELADGRRVRVLGIDSCEAGTPGGRRATERAETLLIGAGVVTVTREPGVGTDRYGRELRYVQTDGIDLGESMVVFDHTGVYSGRNDASDEYLARLRDLDRATGRDCAGRPAPAYVPVPNVGGGDDDDDGESRFCRKRLWC